MDSEFAPIETCYRGYRFRSRLEARWAVVFDTLGWHWEYEPEGFDLPAGKYLPDFLVYSKGGKGWWEIKPARAVRPTRPVLDPRWVDLVRVTGCDLVVAFGLPDPVGPAWDMWALERQAEGIRLTLSGFGTGRGWLVERARPTGPDPGVDPALLASSRAAALAREWVPAVEAGRAARFEHHRSDPSALPREPVPLGEAVDDVRDAMQRAAGER